MVMVIWRSLQAIWITYLQRNLRFDNTQHISTNSYTVLKRDRSFNLFCTGSFRFSASDDNDDGDVDAANVDVDDDDDDDERGYLHDNMETRHDLEMMGNWQ